MAKLLKLRRGSTSQHSSFTGAEGEVTVDTDKDTLVVHDGSTAGGHPVAAEDMANVSSSTIAGRFSDDAINPSKIAGGTLGTDVKVADGNINGNLTIENADVTSTAAIAGTKISPDFGSQNIVTTGTLSSGAIAAAGDITITDPTPSIIFTDNDSNPDYQVGNINGEFLVKDTTNNAVRLKVNTDGHLDLNGNVDISSGVDVTGNITVTGTVDGVDVAALKTSKDSLSTTNGTILGSAVLANGVTATTQSASDNSTKVATTAYTDTAISNLVDSSPGALNTLNELAAAINDDANFSTTITNSIATKMPLAGGEFTGAVTCEDITPDFDSNRNLGSNSMRFANVYADNFVGSGANLTGIESFVTGMILLWSGAANAIPSGFVLCDGNNSTPNLSGRFVVGYSASDGDYDVNDTGGSASVTLSTSQIPAHSHTTDNHTHSFDAGNHTHSFSGSGSSDHSHDLSSGSIRARTSGSGHSSTSLGRINNAGSNASHVSFANNIVNLTGNSGNATVSLSVSGNTGNGAVSGNTGNSNPSTNNTGGGGSHENRPPFYALCYIMKT